MPEIQAHNFDLTESEILHIQNLGGKVDSGLTELLCDRFQLSLEQLMMKLVDFAASFSRATVSDYVVGAVAKGVKNDSSDSVALYLGTNIEFSGLSLNHTVHAEQSAISNAWLHGESGIDMMATSALPCGHCRQFMHEVCGKQSLPLIFKDEKKTFKNGFQSTTLEKLLPDTFGPESLGVKGYLMSSNDNPAAIELSEHCSDLAVLNALQAAKYSYAPYTGNLAGCVIESADGTFYSGRYAENAAYNPSLSPLLSAYSNFLFHHNKINEQKLKRVILVEKTSKISQKQMTLDLLQSLNGDIRLEYFLAEESQ